jgi:hypothetical protein
MLEFSIFLISVDTILEFIYNNSGKIFIFNFFVIIVFMSNERIENLYSSFSENVQSITLILLLMICSYPFIVNYFYCGESCINEKRDALIRKAENERIQRMLIKECDKKDGVICECCGECYDGYEHDCECDGFNDEGYVRGPLNQ